MRVVLIGVLAGLVSCRESERPRFVVKQVPINKNERIEWYNYSEISNYGLDRVDYVDSTGERTLIYKSHVVSDIAFRSDTIQIYWWRKEGSEALSEIEGHPVKVDSGGCSFMSSDSRRSQGKDWKEDICLENLEIIEFERKNPNQYQETDTP